MKYIFRKQTYLLLLAAATLVGCNDFLDKLPENSVEVAKVDYTNISDMYKPVSGVYGVSRQSLSFWAGYGLTSVRSDDTDKGSNANDQIEFQYCKEFKYDKIKEYWALNATWNGLYKIVSTANAAIQSLELYKENITADNDKVKYDTYTAEARFLRAFAFYRITQLWGDAPLMLDNQVAGMNRTPKADIRKFIGSEMDYCISKLPALRPNEVTERPGSVTKYTALMLKAKVALMDGDYNTVLSATNDIIGSGKFSLNNDFYQLFKIPGKLNNESLLEIQFTDFGSGSGEVVVSDNWFAFQGPRGSSKPIEGWGFMVPSQGVRDFFASRNEGTRATTTFLLTNSTTPSGDKIPAGQPGEPTCYNGKAYTPANQMTAGRNDYGMNNNIRVFRYADVLLMNAEAKTRLGQNGDASLNLVRQRAGLAPLTNATVDQILDERRAELAMEWGERFYDLVRTGKASTVLPNFKAGDEFYPIPQEQEDLNPNLAK